MEKIGAYILILVSIVLSALSVGWAVYANSGSEILSWAICGGFGLAVLVAQGVVQRDA